MLLDIRPAAAGPARKLWIWRHGTARTGAEPDAPRGPADQAAAFRNLCRSSPWKWQSLRFEYLDRPLTGPRSRRRSPGDLVRAWLRRPGALRLETADGLVLAQHHRHQ